MTPAELKIYSDVYVEDLKLRRQRSQVDIYNLALLTRGMIWGRHAPKYEQVFPGSGSGQKRRQMTDDEMYANVRALNRALGGEEDE